MQSKLDLSPGALVGHDGRPYRITRVLDLTSVLATDAESGDPVRLKIQSLTTPPAPAQEEPTAIELATIPAEDWAIARKRHEAILPLLGRSDRTAAEVKATAKRAGVHPVTVYRWISAFEGSGRVSSLLPGKSDGGKGKGRLAKEVEVIIQATIEDFHLTEQRVSPEQTFREVLRRCKHANLTPPHANTVRNRIRQLSEKYVVKKRHGAKQAREQFSATPGSFPGARWPLSVIQIDHTKADIILVDEVERRPIGRPWLTLAIDVYSRMVAGFYVSFDPPGAQAAGMCLVHAILPKQDWLAQRSIEVEWPISGFMDVVHLDNAKEFRGAMLERACSEYGIDIHWRPVGRPEFGGHIERLLGSFAREMHTLPGTTFSDIDERGEYDSDKNSALTLEEFERWLTIFICKVYHNRFHHGIGTTPLKRYEEGILGTDQQPGRGLPEIAADTERLRLDFMPMVERTVQPYGIMIDEVCYFHDVLNRWVNAKDESGRAKRKFVVRRDPRNISKVYFFDPELKEYFSIPYRNTSHPPISLWELREIHQRLKKDGRRAVNEQTIFAAYDEMHSLTANAVRESRKKRRDAQRKRDHIRATEERPRLSRPLDEAELILDDQIKPFEDIELQR